MEYDKKSENHGKWETSTWRLEKWRNHWKTWKMRNEHCRTWNMAIKTENHGKWEIHNLGREISRGKLKKLDNLVSSVPPTRQQERRHSRILLHTFIQSYFFLFISPLFISSLFLYLPCFYISPLIVILSRIIILPLTRASHSYILSVPIHAQQATPPHQARSFS